MDDSDKKPKKSETLEVRVPWRLKQDFMARARREGRSASEVIRDLMQDYVRRPAQRTTPQTLETAMTAIRKRPRAGFAAILGAAGMSALLAGTIPAGAASDFRAQFESLDLNGDGIVTLEEFESRATAEVMMMQRDGAAPTGAPGRILLPAEGHDAVHGAVTVRRFAHDDLDAVMVEWRASQDADIAPGSHLSAEDSERLVTHLVLGPVSEGRQDLTASFIDTQIMAMAPHLPRFAHDFAQADSNGDGVLSLEEFAAHHRNLRDESFAALDANGDGVIDMAEARAFFPDSWPLAEHGRTMLSALDADNDGRITRAEYEAAF